MYKRIRDLREDRDLSQREMGLILHCSQRVYSNYECGDLDIPTSILIELARFHNVSTDYLLDLTDCREPYLRTLKNEAPAAAQPQKRQDGRSRTQEGR